MVALGEVGLDYFRNKSSKQAQLRALQWQLKLARELGLPLVIHCRQAEEDMLPTLEDRAVSLKNTSQLIGVTHCFIFLLQAVMNPAQLEPNRLMPPHFVVVGGRGPIV